MPSAIGGSCPNNESVCFSPLLVAHVLIMNHQYAFPRYWCLMSVHDPSSSQVD